MTEPTTFAPPAAARSDSGLVRSLGLFTTITIIVGGVIGSGIFKKPGVMAAQVGSPEVLLFVWVLAGVITIFGAMSIAEVAGLIPETGGQYVHFDRIYGPFVAYLFGWSLFAVVQTGSIAALAYVCAEAFDRVVPLPELRGAIGGLVLHLPVIGDIAPFKEAGIKLGALAVIGGLTAVNYLGVRFGGMVQNVSTIAKLAGMFALVVVAFLLSEVGRVANFTTASATIRPQGVAMIAAVAAAMQGAFWAFDGWNKLTFIAGEVKEPQRTIPRGLVIGMFIVTAIYLSMTLAYMYVMPVDQMAVSKLVAADVAERCMAGGGKWISVAIVISTFGACNATILASARIYFSMARQNVFPRFLGAAHPRFHTPAASLVVQAVWSSVLLLSGTFDTLTDTLIFVSWIFYAAAAYGVLLLRRRLPDAPRPFRVPGYPVVPWIFVLFAAGYLVMTIYNDIASYQKAVAAGQPGFINSAFGAVLVLAGAPVYFYYRARQRKLAAASAP